MYVLQSKTDKQDIQNARWTNSIHIGYGLSNDNYYILWLVHKGEKYALYKTSIRHGSIYILKLRPYLIADTRAEFGFHNSYPFTKDS